MANFASSPEATTTLVEGLPLAEEMNVSIAAARS
jgi:hypothetical protein